MFWGITIEGGKKYTQVLERSFHVTMAALGFSNANPEPVSVLVDINQTQFVLCTLQAGKIPQQPLSLEFTEGEEVSFSIEGDGEVHLTGYILPEPREYEFSSEEDENEGFIIDDGEEEDEEPTSEGETLEKAVESKKKSKQVFKKNGKSKLESKDTSMNGTALDERTKKDENLQIANDKITKKTKKKNRKNKKRKHENENIDCDSTDNKNKNEISPKKKPKKKK